LLDDMSQSFASDVLPALIRASSIDRSRFVADLGRRGLPVSRAEDLRELDVELIDPVARSIVQSARRVSAVSGVGLGMGGWLAVAPEVLQQMVMLLKMAQRLSLLYGIDYQQRTGEVLVWKAMAHAVGADSNLEGATPASLQIPARLGRTGMAVNPIVSRIALAVLQRIALRLSAPLGRMVPVVGSGVGMLANYAQMGRAGRRMMEFYRCRRYSLGRSGFEDLVEVEVLG
jgi:hypothetical protein